MIIHNGHWIGKNNNHQSTIMIGGTIDKLETWTRTYLWLALELCSLRPGDCCRFGISFSAVALWRNSTSQWHTHFANYQAEPTSINHQNIQLCEPICEDATTSSSVAALAGWIQNKTPLFRQCKRAEHFLLNTLTYKKCTLIQPQQLQFGKYDNCGNGFLLDFEVVSNETWSAFIEARTLSCISKNSCLKCSSLLWPTNASWRRVILFGKARVISRQQMAQAKAIRNRSSNISFVKQIKIRCLHCIVE